MANTIGFGQGAVNNTNGFGKAPTNNTIDFGEVCADSWSPETNLTGSSGAFANTQSTQYDGIDAHVELSNPSSLQISGNFSISVWIKYSSIIQGYAFSGCGNKYGIYVQNNLINLQHRDSGNVFRNVTSTSTFNDNQWHHVLGVNDGTNLKLYIDGTLNNSNALGGANITSTGNARIGNISTASGWEFTGYIDEVAIWNSDQSSIASAIGSSPVDLSTYSPLHWYRFEGTGTTATDNGSGANNGVLDNTVVRSTDVPT